MKLLRLAGGLLACAVMLGVAAAQEDKKDKPKPPPPPDPTLTECIVPFRPAIVLDGATATSEEINTLAARIRRYQGLLNEYRACLEPSMNAAKGSDPARYNELIKQYNDSVNAEEEVVAAYQKIIAARKAAEKSSAPKT